VSSRLAIQRQDSGVVKWVAWAFTPGSWQAVRQASLLGHKLLSHHHCLGCLLPGPWVILGQALIIKALQATLNHKTTVP
jgi:hypothetical protein